MNIHRECIVADPSDGIIPIHHDRARHKLGVRGNVALILLAAGCQSGTQNEPTWQKAIEQGKVVPLARTVRQARQEGVRWQEDGLPPSFWRESKIEIPMESNRPAPMPGTPAAVSMSHREPMISAKEVADDLRSPSVDILKTPRPINRVQLHQLPRPDWQTVSNSPTNAKASPERPDQATMTMPQVSRFAVPPPPPVTETNRLNRKDVVTVPNSTKVTLSNGSATIDNGTAQSAPQSVIDPRDAVIEVPERVERPGEIISADPDQSAPARPLRFRNRAARMEP